MMIKNRCILTCDKVINNPLLFLRMEVAMMMMMMKSTNLVTVNRQMMEMKGMTVQPRLVFTCTSLVAN